MNCFYLQLEHPNPYYLYHLFSFYALDLDLLGEQALIDVFLNFFKVNLIYLVIFVLIFSCFFLKVLIIVGNFSKFRNLYFLLHPFHLMITISDVQNLDCFFFSYLYQLLKLLALILLVFLKSIAIKILLE